MKKNKLGFLSCIGAAMNKFVRLFLLTALFFGMAFIFKTPAFAQDQQTQNQQTVICGNNKKCDTSTHKCLRCIEKCNTTGDSFFPGTTTYYSCALKGEKTTKRSLDGCTTTCEDAPDGGTGHSVGILPKDPMKKGCQPIQEKLNELHDCLLCGMFEVVLRTNQTMATKSFSALNSSFMNLIIVVMALFIAYKTLMTVSALTKQDVGKYLGEILVQAFKVLLAALLLSKSIYIYHYVINPLVEAAMEFGLAIIGNDALIGLKTFSDKYVSKMPSGVISQDVLSKVMGTPSPALLTFFFSFSSIFTICNIFE